METDSNPKSNKNSIDSENILHNEKENAIKTETNLPTQQNCLNSDEMQQNSNGDGKNDAVDSNHIKVSNQEEIKDDHSINDKNIPQQLKNTEQQSNENSNQPSTKEITNENDQESKSNEQQETKQNDFTEQKETNNNEQQKTNNNEQQETNNNEQNETNNNEQHETNNNEQKETNNNEQKETNNNEQQETESNEQQETESNEQQGNNQASNETTDEESDDKQNQDSEDEEDTDSDDSSESNRSNLDSQSILISKARYYQNANALQGKDWYDMSVYLPKIQSPDDYTIINNIDSGKFSTVYQAIREDPKRPGKKIQVALKVLLPYDIRKYLKEIKVLSDLNGHSNIVGFHGLIQDPQTKVFSIALEWVVMEKYSKIYPKFSIDDTRYFMKLFLEGLDYAHAHGIIHRDLKPGNLGIDLKKKTLKILDWGLAEFYQPGVRINPQAGTRAYLSPEQLIRYPYLDYSTDIWSAGLVFGMMLFASHVIEPAGDNEKQLMNLAKLIGGQQIINLVGMLDMRMNKDLMCQIRAIKAEGFDPLIEDAKKRKRVVPPEAVDLLKNMLAPDFRTRISAHEALNHPFIVGKTSS